MLRIFLCVWSSIPPPSHHPPPQHTGPGEPTRSTGSYSCSVYIRQPCIILGNVLNLLKLLSQELTYKVFLLPHSKSCRSASICINMDPEDEIVSCLSH